MPSTRRFQSRLFQTVQSGLHQLQDRLQLRWRQLKVSATWNAQLVFYPLQASVQAGRWVAQAVRQAVAEVRSLAAPSSAKPVNQTKELIQADQPIRNVLSALQSYAALTSNALAVQAQEIAPELLSPSTEQASAIVTSTAATPTLKQRWTTRLQRWWGNSLLAGTVASNAVESSAVQIQGLASSLEHRRLVLTTVQNGILDCLSDEQQRWLQERIRLELSAVSVRQMAYSNRLKLRFAKLALPSLRSGRLRLQQAWHAVLSLGPALADSLLLPGSMPARMPRPVLSLMPRRTDPSRLLNALPRLVPRLQSFWQSLTVVMGTVSPLPPQVEWIDPVQNRRHWLRNLDLFRQSKPIQGKVRLAPDKTPAALAGPFSRAVADWSYRFNQTVPSSGYPAIDINAAFMGYHYHPLERLLLFLDQIMAWLEALVFMIWRRGQDVLQQLRNVR
jgi:hypothetical protein